MCFGILNCSHNQILLSLRVKSSRSPAWLSFHCVAQMDKITQLWRCGMSVPMCTVYVSHVPCAVVCTCMSQVSPSAISCYVRDVRMRCFNAWFCAVQKSIFIAWERKTSERSFSYFHIYTQFAFWLFLYCEKRHSKLISRAIFHRTHTNTLTWFRFSRSPCGEREKLDAKVHF